MVPSDDTMDRSDELARHRSTLDELVSKLSGEVLALDDYRRTCVGLARRHEELARRLVVEQPEIAAAARRIARLLLAGDRQLEWLCGDVVSTIAEGGRIADGSTGRSGEPA